ncbi:MAG: hypothetical protein IKF64_05845 [Eubacterium sp.]|nr:hypothetical protein [Eubacterium sp.]
MNTTENKHIIIDCEIRGFDRKLCHKKNAEEFFYLTKKGFKNYSDSSKEPITVIGDVFIRRRKPENIKVEGDVIGIVKIPYSYKYLHEHYDASDDDYPIYKTKKQWRRTIGYAQLENHQFVRLVKFDARFLLIILLLLFVLIPCLFKFCSDIKPIDIVSGEAITDNVKTPEQSPICYYEPFEEVTVLTKDNPELSLKNVASNYKTYFVSYEIYINGVAIKDKGGKVFTTGAIPPDKQVKINLWKKLKQGNYTLEVKATDYDYTILKELTDNRSKYSDKDYQSLLNEATKPVHHTLSTTLIIKK